jgi:hypothetical protein
MFRNLYIFSFLFCFQLFKAQSGFQFTNSKSKITIPFKFVSNLIIVPIEVNGVKLNFLLDTGVSETILFSLDETNEIKFENIEKVKFRGLGKSEPFEGLKSTKNILSSNSYFDVNHTIYVVLDQDINISSQVGFPINGVIGYHFFKNYPIEINYKTNKIIVRQKVIEKNLKNFDKFPISIEENKPYVNALITFDSNKELNSKLLIDTGNSTSVWLFKEENNAIELPKLGFIDFLGRGFSGNIYGFRGRLKSFKLNKFDFSNPLIAFPDSTATKDLELVKDRVGSIGNEIMKRFTTIYDYNNNTLYLKKNGNFKLPFNFNMSGVELQHDGLQWVQVVKDNSTLKNTVSFEKGGENVSRELKYTFTLKSKYSIMSIRKDSPADVVGLKEGDVIVKINGYNAYVFTLEEINDILKSKEGRTIVFEINRNGTILTFKINLKSII